MPRATWSDYSQHTGHRICPRSEGTTVIRNGTTLTATPHTASNPSTVLTAKRTDDQLTGGTVPTVRRKLHTNHHCPVCVCVCLFACDACHACSVEVRRTGATTTPLRVQPLPPGFAKKRALINLIGDKTVAGCTDVWQGISGCSHRWQCAGSLPCVCVFFFF